MANLLDDFLSRDRSIRLMGAYGRETSPADWEAGKDFIIVQPGRVFGPYCSIRDRKQMIRDGFSSIIFITRKGEVLCTEHL